MTINKTYAVIIGMLISLSALAEGMYRDGSQFVFMILVSVLSVIFIIARNVDFVPRTLLDWFVATCIPVYIIASFDAVSPWDSVATLARYLCCYIVYYIAKEVLCNNRLLFYRVIYYISSVISLYGLWLGISGEAFEVKRGLLLSVFGYHNASAVFFAAVFLLGIYIVTKSGLKERIVVAACNSLLAFSIVFTQSRGTWLVFFLCVLVYIILSRKSGSFSDILVSVGASLVGVLTGLNGFSEAFAKRNSVNFCESYAECFVYIALSVIVSVAICFICEKTNLKRIFTPKFALVAVPVILVLMIIFIMFLAPASITERIRDFSFSSSTVSERQLFFKDAMRMFAENPVNGVGGNCWQYVYPSIQRQFYTVAHPHNFFAEMATDAGVFGAVLYAFMIVAFIFTSVKKKGEDKVPAKLIGLLVILHSFIDFDTDYFTILSLLFVVFAIISSKDEESSAKKQKFMLVIPAVLLVWAALNGISMLNYNKAVTAAKDNIPITKVYSYSKTATRLMPLKSDYLTVHGNVCIGLGTNDSSYLKEAQDVLKRSLSLNKYHYETITQLAMCYIKQGDYKASCDTISKLVVYQPFIPVTHMRISNMYETVEKYGEDTANIDCIIYACNMMKKNFEYAYDVSAKCRARIEMDTQVRVNYGNALRILEKLEELGVES